MSKAAAAACLILAFCCGGCASHDAYIYGVPEGVRFSYTDIPMYECSWCHRTKNLNRHHIIPQSASKSLCGDASNIIVLCRDCHFVLGHRCNWKQFNPDVVYICNTYTNTIKSAEYTPVTVRRLECDFRH